MQKPIKPYPPFASDFDKKIEKVYIYSYVKSLKEYDCYDEDDNPEAENKEPIDEINLQWLVNQVPEGIELKDIKIEFDYNASAMAFEDHYVKFYYEKTIPARKAEHKAALDKFKEDMLQYNKDMLEYEKYQKEEEIRKTEEKLARLKAEK